MTNKNKRQHQQVPMLMLRMMPLKENLIKAPLVPLVLLVVLALVAGKGQQQGLGQAPTLQLLLIPVATQTFRSI
jgi:hypothetical protein